MQKQEKLAIIENIAKSERLHLLQKYNGNLMGKCIEVSDTIVQNMQLCKMSAKAKQVWVLYENFESCMECCYEEHWLVEIHLSGEKYFLDVTMDQFQWAFYRKLPEIYFDRKLPNFYLVRKPGKATLSKCGWTDWYNTGNYINNFDYWS